MVFTKNVHVAYYVNHLSGVEKSRVFTTSTKKRKVGITLQKKIYPAAIQKLQFT